MVTSPGMRPPQVARPAPGGGRTWDWRARTTGVGTLFLRRPLSQQEHSPPGQLCAVHRRPVAQGAWDGDDREAQDLLRVVHGAAVRLGEDRDDYQTAFGVSQVVMQRVEVAVVAGDYVRALDTAAGVSESGRTPCPSRTVAEVSEGAVGRSVSKARAKRAVARLHPRCSGSW
jgi:hypothetical protein